MKTTTGFVAVLSPLNMCPRGLLGPSSYASRHNFALTYSLLHSFVSQRRLSGFIKNRRRLFEPKELPPGRLQIQVSNPHCSPERKAGFRKAMTKKCNSLTRMKDCRLG